MIDNDIRRSIIKSEGNIIISAGAGSGKTTLLTTKILKEVEERKSHYKIAAITFTQKAANEIKIKMKGKVNGNFVGTNDSFAEQEIIRPFLQDAYGGVFNTDFIVTYTSNKFDFYKEGIDLLRNKSILASYNNKYMNFKFELALNILKNSKVARQYLIARYTRIYIDEYQDSDADMHNLFMYIKDLGIKLFIVGDIKQSIYSWRGAKPELFKDIYNNDDGFERYELKENFRCSIDIQNYANVVEYGNIQSYQENQGSNDVIGTKTKIFRFLNMEEEIAILVRRNNEAEEFQDDLRSKGYNFVFIPRTPLDDLGTNNKNILIELAKYAKNKIYTHYDFVNNIPGEFNKKEIMEIKEIISPLKEYLDRKSLEQILLKIFAYLELSFFEDKEIKSFIDSVIDVKYENSFNGKEFKHKIMTIHSAKGLEFEQVIIFAHNYNINLGKDKEEHYVATTRAKRKLLIALDNETYLSRIKNICSFIGVEVGKLINIVE